MVFQRPNPLPISIYENVVFGLRIHTPRARAEAARPRRGGREGADRGRPGKDLKDRLHDQATTLQLEQQQKLCIARLLPLKPEVILMDEPCSALDVEGTRAIEELMFELRGPLHDRHRDAQHGPGAARERRVHLHAARRGHRARADGGSVPHPARPADGGVHRRPLRLSRPGRPQARGACGPRVPTRIAALRLRPCRDEDREARAAGRARFPP